jgi:hypothetical protein
VESSAGREGIIALQRPIHGCIAAASAFVGTIILALGIGELVKPEHGRGVGFFFLGWGVLMWFPVFARPAKTEAQVEKHWRRFRLPALLCMGFGFVTTGAALLIDRGYFYVRNAPNVAVRVGALGSALWLVGFVLLFFAAYYQSQLRIRDDGTDADDDDAYGDYDD